MFDRGLEYLKKMLPEVQKKPAPEPAPASAALIPAAGAQPAPQLSPPKPPVQPPQKLPPSANAVEMLDNLAAFLRQYIVCDQHQLNVLALWIVHTWCYQHFPTTAYLNFYSPEPQSGKTRCLELLKLLSQSPWLVTGGYYGDIMSNLLPSGIRSEKARSEKARNYSPPHTILLDDCHHTFTPLERQPLLALLNTGSSKNGRYLFDRAEYCFFGPKAFASNAPLPSSLALRCIPIKLERRKLSDSIRRFDPQVAGNAVSGLLAWLNAISHNPDWIVRKAQETPAAIPRRLTPREQDCAEPLIHIADAIGGHWPEKARTAIDAIFQHAPGTMTTELLCDIRAIFFLNRDPEYLSTKDLLAGLAGREYRPWNSWKNTSGKKLAMLLQPFDICSQQLCPPSAPKFRGYLFKSFQDAWERYVPPLPPDSAAIRDSGTVSGKPK